MLLSVLLSGAHAFWPVDNIATWWKGDTEQLGTKRALEVLTNNNADYFEARPKGDYWPQERASEAVYRSSAQVPNFDDFEDPEARSADQELDELLGQLQTMLEEEENNPNGRSISEQDLDAISMELDALESKVQAQPEPRMARSIDDFWPEEDTEDFFEPKQPRGFEDEEDTLDQLEELIMNGHLSPKERAMIEEALEDELNDLEEEYDEPIRSERGALDELDSELDELEQMIMKGDLSPQERSIIAEALEEELRDLGGMDEPAQDFPERSIEDFDSQEALDELEQLLMSGDLSPKERAMIEEALQGEINDIEEEMGQEEDMWEPEARGFADEEDTLAQLEELIMTGDLSPKERAMIEEALQDELSNLQEETDMQWEPEARTVDDFADEEDTLDQLEELIMSGDLSPKERAMIEEALEGELNDLQEEEDMQWEPQNGVGGGSRAVDDFADEEDTLDQLEELIMSGDLSPQERAMIEEALEGELNDLQEENDMQWEPEARAVDEFADEEDTLDQLEDLLMSGELSPQERAMIQEALQGELNDLEAEMGEQPQERSVDDFWPDDSLSNDFWPEQEPRAVDDFWPEPRAVDDFWPEEQAVTDFWPEEQEQFKPKARSILDDIDSEDMEDILSELEQMVQEKKARGFEQMNQTPRNQRFAPQRTHKQEWQY